MIDTQSTPPTQNGRTRVERRLPRTASEKASSNKKRFSWTIFNFWLDSLLLVNFLALVCVSVIVQFIFPAASSAQGWTLWGWTLDGWMSAQFALIGLLSFGILIHIMVHWSWVCGVLFGKIWPSKKGAKLPDDGIRTIYGVGFMIVILNAMGLLIAIAALTVQSAT